ncbi:tRNA dihydrouridine synthase DusB [Peptoniphilus mikwangii]|uniref:tRNA dihydrouridine synthase DusB n=1 Tax=Peptoniphilus mikwangii TaxID=1354300 RepID=UPI00041A094B|nr:tRNA dihydrouridine synthase DusB [Peptoniphilus mikwangii]
MKKKIDGAILSPLAGYTDIAFREICSQKNAYMTVTEMISAKALYYGDKKTNELLKVSPFEKNVAVQIFGDDPDIMGYVVKNSLNSLNFSCIDINMGCPAPKIVKNNNGSALLDQPNLAYSIIKSVVENSNVPVSVKIRKGIRNTNSIEVARLAQKAGASFITVHGRTREEYYSGLSDWNYIKSVVDELTIPVIGNGDVQSYEDAMEKIKFSGVSGVSIGRGAIGNPFIFDEIYKKSIGYNYEKPTDLEKIEMALSHLKLNCAYKGEKIGILEMRKHFVGYFKGMKGSKELRDKINKINNLEEIEEIICKYMQQ